MSTQTERLVATLDGDSSGLRASLQQAAQDAKGLSGALDAAGRSARDEMAAGVAKASGAAEALGADAKAATGALTGIVSAQKAVAQSASAAAVETAELGQAQRSTASAADSVATAEKRAAVSTGEAAASSVLARRESQALSAGLLLQSKEVAATSNTWGRYKGVIDGAVTKMGPAGEMVNKVTTLLGPMGLALGGVTAAFVGANLGVGAFNDATTRMLEKTEQGRAVLAAIEPDFVTFGKVLSEQFERQNDVAEAGARAQAVNLAWRDVLEGVTAPFVAFGGVLGSIADAMLGVEERTNALRTQMDALAAKAADAKALDAYKKGLESLDAGIAAYVESQYEAVDEVAQGEQLIGDLQVKIANRAAAGFESEAIRAQVFQDVLSDRTRLVREATESERDQLFALVDARDMAVEAQERETAAAQRSVAARRQRAAERPAVDVGAGVGGAMDAVARAQEAAQREAAARAEADEQARRDRMFAAKQTEFELIQKGIDLQNAAKVAEEERSVKALALMEQEKAARRELGAVLDQYAGGFVKSMARVTIAQAKDAKAQRAAYRTLVADQIQALGDYATSKSIVSAAEGNFAMAATLATAAATAYATASIMRPSQAPSASAAGAAPAATQAQPQLTTINNTLVLNDSFSDSEAVARRFATVYRATTDRGMIPQGA